MGMVLRRNIVLLRCKCMHVLEYMIVLSCLVIRFRPTSRIVSRLYRERTMEKLRTNEDARSNELKHVLARKTRPNRFWTWLAFQLVLFLLYTRHTCQTGFHFAATTLQRKKKKERKREKRKQVLKPTRVHWKHWKKKKRTWQNIHKMSIYKVCWSK